MYKVLICVEKCRTGSCALLRQFCLWPVFFTKTYASLAKSFTNDFLRGASVKIMLVTSMAKFELTLPTNSACTLLEDFRTQLDLSNLWRLDCLTFVPSISWSSICWTSLGSFWMSQMLRSFCVSWEGLFRNRLWIGSPEFEREPNEFRLSPDSIRSYIWWWTKSWKTTLQHSMEATITRIKINRIRR